MLCYNPIMIIETSKEKTCCFTGHRRLPWGRDEQDINCRRLKLALADVLQAVYSTGYRHFICGMATGADLYFGEAVVALRDEHPSVTLEAAIPFSGQEKKWDEALRARYARLAESCDEVTVLRGEYTPTCMMDRNRYMVDCSSVVIAVFDGRSGGTKNTVQYALSSGVKVIQLPVFASGD